MQGVARPLLTKICEQVLRGVTAARNPEGDPVPLRRVPASLLAVKVHGMGDGVMVRSLLEHLNERQPGMEIGVLAGPATREVLSRGSSFRVHSYDQRGLTPGTILRRAADIRRCRYEAVLNLEQGSLAGTAFLRALGIPTRIGFLPVHESAKAAFLTTALRFREGDSMWASFIRAIRVVDPGFPDAPPVARLPLGDDARDFADGWLTETLGAHRTKLAAFHMGSGPGQPFRRWPVERFVELGEQLRAHAPNLAIVLTGTAPEKPLVDAFLSHYGGRAIDATAIGSLERTAAVLAACDLLVSNDTGVMHLGAAMGTPTVGIFGPDSPGRYAPVGPRTAAVAASGVPCSPCSNIYRLLVPPSCANPDHLRCLREVAAADVFAAARRIVRGAWLGGMEPAELAQ